MDHGVAILDATVVTSSHPFGAPPIFQPYRVHAPGSDVAFQTGRSDELGRVSFVPDRAGEWRIVVSTEDGHGAAPRAPSYNNAPLVAPAISQWLDLQPSAPRLAKALAVLISCIYV